MTMPWFRMYHEFAHDPKVQLLSFENQRHFVVLLCLKCSGTLDSSTTSIAYRESMISMALRVPTGAAADVKSALMGAGLIDDSWQPVAWESRQYESDSSAARTRKYRERRMGTPQQRHGDVTVTSQQRHGDVTVTDKNRTEQNRTDKKAGRMRPIKRAIPDDFVLTPELSGYITTALPDADPLRLFTKFTDEARAKGWVYADWSRALQTYTRNCAHGSGHFAAGQYPKKSNANGIEGVTWM